MFFRTCSEREQISLENRFPIPFAPVFEGCVLHSIPKCAAHIPCCERGVCRHEDAKAENRALHKTLKIPCGLRNSGFRKHAVFLTKYISHADGHTGSGMAMNIKTTAPAHPQMYRRGLL